MGIIRSGQGEEIEFEIFEGGISEGELRTEISALERPLNKLFDFHQEAFAGSIHIPYWREAVLVLQAGEEVDPRNLALHSTTSYHLQAVRKGVADDVVPVVVSGLLRTSDDRLVYGVRGGEVKNGFLAIVPAGSLSAAHASASLDPLFASYFAELKEETSLVGGMQTEQEGALLSSGVSSSRLVGRHSDPDFTMAQAFVFYTELNDVPFSDLQQIHSDAFAAYQAKMDDGVSEREARSAIAQASFTNVDAWEHSRLVGIPHDAKHIDSLINSRVFNGDGGARYPLLDHGRVPLVMYRKIADFS